MLCHPLTFTPNVHHREVTAYLRGNPLSCPLKIAPSLHLLFSPTPPSTLLWKCAIPSWVFISEGAKWPCFNKAPISFTKKKITCFIKKEMEHYCVHLWTPVAEKRKCNQWWGSRRREGSISHQLSGASVLPMNAQQCPWRPKAAHNTAIKHPASHLLSWALLFTSNAGTSAWINKVRR